MTLHTIKYLVLDEHGDALSSESTADGARDVAADYAGEKNVIDETGGYTDEGSRVNPWTARSGRVYGGDYETAEMLLGEQKAKKTSGALAFKQSGLPQVTSDDILELTEGLTDPRGVYDALAPYLEPMEFHAGQRSESFATPGALVRNLLTANFKTAKEKAERPDWTILGLALVPFWQASNLFDRMGVDLIDNQRGVLKLLKESREDPEYFRKAPASGLRNLCVGSTQACRAACLVMTGSNVQDYNTLVKFQKTRALMEHPHEFVAALAMNLAIFARNALQGGRLPFVRLNMLADIPWELVAPGLFDLFPGFDAMGPLSRDPMSIPRRTKQALFGADYSDVMPLLEFYDYTKVAPARREQPVNYDWTFSFSGGNEAECKESLASGTRVAVVFAPADPRVARDTHNRASQRSQIAEMAEHETFWGYPIVSGEDSDHRPADPGEVVVGLSFKPPKLLPERQQRALQRSSFVVPVVEIEGRNIAVQTPSSAWADPTDTIEGRAALELERMYAEED